MAKGKYRAWLEPERLILLEGWARDGLTLEEIAHNMGIVPSTLYEWIGKYSEISEALKNGREVADYIIENALFRSATGYDTEEVVTEIRDGKKYIKKTKKHIPANVTAQIFWLKNRRADRWKDRREEVVQTTISQEAIDDIEEYINGLQEGEDSAES